MNAEIIYNRNNYSILDFLLHPAYKKDKQYNLVGFIEENLLSMNNEAEQVVIYLAPIIFNINIELYVIERVYHNDPNKAHFLKESMRCQDEKNTDTLYFFYRLPHFDILYSNEMYQAFAEILPKVPVKAVDQVMKRFTLNENFSCEKCKQTTISVQLADEKYLPFCKDCLDAYIKDRVTDRVKNFIAENFNNFECNFLFIISLL
jgi:hypothetical protein